MFTDFREARVHFHSLPGLQKVGPTLFVCVFAVLQISVALLAFKSNQVETPHLYRQIKMT
jgi:hypothetical protein